MRVCVEEDGHVAKVDVGFIVGGHIERMGWMDVAGQYRDWRGGRSVDLPMYDSIVSLYNYSRAICCRERKRGICGRGCGCDGLVEDGKVGFDVVGYERLFGSRIAGPRLHQNLENTAPHNVGLGFIAYGIDLSFKGLMV